MKINHFYKINNIKRERNLNGISDVVIQIDFTLMSSFDENPGLYPTETNRIIKFNNVELNYENFIPYEELTQELVSSWISQRSRDLEMHHEKIMNELLNPSEPQYIQESPPWIS